MCVGPRSAVFAPMRGLGLIVVDEEHDSSYKHEGDPRYDARRVAERRAAQAGAVLVAGSATPRPESVHALARLRLPARVDGARLPPVEVVDMREAGRALHPPYPRGAHRCPQGDRPAQPPRVVELPDLPLVRAGVGVPVVRRHARHASRGRPAGLPSLRPSRARADALRCLRLGLDRAPWHGHRAPGVRARGQRLPPGRRGGRPRARAGGLRGGAARRARRHADGGQGPRLPRRRPRRRGRRRRDPALPGLPRRGAHLRPRHAARRARGPRAPPAGAVLVQTLAPDAPDDPLRGRATTPTGSWPRSSSAAARCAIRPSRRSSASSARRRLPGAALAAATAVRARLSDALGPAPLFRLRGRERAQVVVKAQDRAAAVAQVGAAVQEAAADRANRAAAFSVDVDPQ